MLVGEPRLELAAFLAAVPDEPGFLLPLFSSRDSNMFRVQEIGPDGSVRSFRDVDPRDPVSAPSPGMPIAPGDPAIWGFRDEGGAVYFGTREGLIAAIEPLVGTIKRPFLNLQLAQFCERSDQLVDAWRAAYRHLAESAPRSAQAWRDVVVIPAQMRFAVEEAILAHGLDASIERLGREVEVIVEGDQLQLRLEPTLHAAFAASAGARESLDHAARPVREAFDLAGERITLVRMQLPEDDLASLYQPESEGAVIAAFGAMATNIASQLLSPRERPRIDGSSRFGPGAANIPKAVLRYDLHTAIGEDQFKLIQEMDLESRVVFIIFELDPADQDLTDMVFDFAEKARLADRVVIAIIPHFPEETEAGGLLSQSILPALSQLVEGIWFLSDRSPYARKALPYGPSRSMAAVMTHLHSLLRLVGTAELKRLHLPITPRGSHVGIIGSVIGDRNVETLARHAASRLSHYMLDLSSTTGVWLHSRVPLDQVHEAAEAVKYVIAPYAEIDFRSETPIGARPGPNELTLELRNVELRPGGTEQFERYCFEQLQRCGWDIQSSVQPDTILARFKAFEEVEIECKLFSRDKLISGLKARRRRKSVRDSIMLTNGIVQRRSFAIQVLNGIVPVHHSRLDSLDRIYGQRYQYLISYLNQEGGKFEAMVLAAATDYLSAHAAIAGHKLGRLQAINSQDAGFALEPKSLSLALPLEFLRKLSGREFTAFGHAIVHIDREGWNIEKLEIDGQSILPV